MGKLSWVTAIVVLLLLPATAAEGLQMRITLNNTADGLSFLDAQLVHGDYVNSSGAGDYAIELYAYNGTRMFTGKFDTTTTVDYPPEASWFAENGTQVVIPTTGETQLQLRKIYLLVPYNPNVTIATVSKQGQQLLTIDLQKFAVIGETLNEPETTPTQVIEYPTVMATSKPAQLTKSQPSPTPTLASEDTGTNLGALITPIGTILLLTLCVIFFLNRKK